MEKTKCARCGKEYETKTMVIRVKNDEEINLFCKDCSNLFGTCGTCKNKVECGFFNNPDPLPRFITIQQKTEHANGYIITQRQVPNTERLRKYCLDGKCPCCNEADPKDPFCCKFTEYTTCANYDEVNYGKIVEDFSMQETKEN